jgi:hypothetical protein
MGPDQYGQMPQAMRRGGAAARDLLQGASNAAASNVSGPVDLIASLLQVAGVPVPNDAVGGSAWMARHGLTQQPQSKLAGAIGEAVGQVTPVVASKVPQLAARLAELGDAGAAVGGLNTGLSRWQRGAIDPSAKQRLVEDLAAGTSSGTYKLGDVTAGQEARLRKLVEAGGEGADVMMTPNAMRHILSGRIRQDGFTPQQVGDFAERALQPRSLPGIDPASANPYPALTNRGVLDPVTGRRYDAIAPLNPTDTGFNLVTVVPKGLRAPMKKPPAR